MDLTRIPEELLKSTRWVLWRLEDFEDRKRCKIPKQVKAPTKNASSTDPATWATATEAVQGLDELIPYGPYAEETNNTGIGLIIGTPYVGVDLDKCYDSETGVVDEWARNIIQKLPKTYTELSPSRKGFHLWYRCSSHQVLPDGVRTEKAEVYSRKRYFTVTGEHVVSTPKTVTEIDLATANSLFTLVQDLRPRRVEALTPVSTRLEELMARADFPDLSAAVHSLLTKLAIEFVCDEKKVEAKFLTSALYLHTHWKEKWPRLRESELAKAIANARENVTKRLSRRTDQEAYQKRGKLINLAAIEPRELNWLWPERVPAGLLTIFAGNPGVGKSLVALDLIGRGSVGAEFLDGKGTTGKFKSLLLSMEDDRETIIVPRLMAMGADLTMVTALDIVELVDDAGEVKDARLFNLESDLNQVRDIIEADPEIKLVVIDPLSNYMGNKSMYRDQEVRDVLMPVIQLAQDTGAAVVVIMHHSKQTGRTALEKIGASLGGVGTARMCWAFMKIDSSHHQMLLAKQNLGRFSGIDYTTEEVVVKIKGKDTGQAKMKYLGKSTAEADDVVNTQEDPEERADRAVHTLIKKLLPPGEELPSKLFFEAAEKAGLAERSLKRARVELGILTSKKAGAWYWKWPEEKAPSPKKSDEAELF